MVPPEKLEEAAMEMASKLASFDQRALKITKQALWHVKGMTREEARLYTWDLLARNADSEHGRKLMREYRERVEKMTGRPYTPGG